MLQAAVRVRSNAFRLGFIEKETDVYKIIYKPWGVLCKDKKTAGNATSPQIISFKNLRKHFGKYCKPQWID